MPYKKIANCTSITITFPTVDSIIAHGLGVLIEGDKQEFDSGSLLVFIDEDDTSA
jgi:hypothetical protein